MEGRSGGGQASGGAGGAGGVHASTLTLKATLDPDFLVFITESFFRRKEEFLSGGSFVSGVLSQRGGKEGPGLDIPAHLCPLSSVAPRVVLPGREVEQQRLAKEFCVV